MRVFFAVILVLFGSVGIIAALGGGLLSGEHTPAELGSAIIDAVFGGAILALGLWLARRRPTAQNPENASETIEGAWAKSTMVGLTVFWWASAIPGLALAFTTMFMFDAPGSDENPLTIALVASFWSFPVLAVVSPLGGWIARVSGAPRIAKLLMLFPLLSVCAAICSGLALEVMCGGSFSCH